jgi:nucleolin
MTRVNGRNCEMNISRGFSVVAEASEGEEGAQAEHKLYIGNLSWNSTDEDLQEIFGEFNVVEASVVMDRNTGRSRGFAFVTLASAEDMERAMAATNGVDVDGRELRVSQAQTAGERRDRPMRMDGERRPQRNRDADNRRVYFGNLSWGMDHLDLQDLCGEFGSVEDSRLITDRETGRSRGFGFVTMSSEAEADEVVAQLNGQDVDGRVLRVNIANSD